MVRIKYTGPPSTVQVQPAPIRNKTQIESKETSRTKLEESLALRQQQSLEMVQIMLHVSFGTLFYLREFLPLGSFDDRDLKQAQRQQRYSYEEFIHGKAHPESPESSQELAFGKGKRGQPLKVILRNSDPKANMILDLLENGIFDALSKNFLEAIQLTILVDKDKPQNVLESYIFSFKYTGTRDDVNNRLESLSLDPVGCVADMKSAQSARTGLEMIVRRLITLSAFLPTLPNKRNLGIHLFYTADCPSEYEPPGFATSTDDTVKYPFNENWAKESQSCGTMNSGCHAVGLKVTSMKWTGPDLEGSEVPPKIPPQIEYKDKMQREAEIGLGDEKNLPCGLASRYGSFQEATQDLTERQKLQMMIPTQASSYPDSELIPTQPINHMGAAADIGGASQKTEHKLCLSKNKALQINEFLRSRTLELAGNTNNQGNEIVKCQCGWDGQESAMITCSFCYTHQHLLCYGFANSNDHRLPETHACYQCLLEPDEAHLFRELHTLVLLRRALKIILDEGFPNKTSTFTQKLHCNGQTIIQITDLLRKQNFLQPTPGSKSKGFLEKGLPKYQVPSGEDTRERMRREILDPLAKIHHHYTRQSTEPIRNAKPKPTADSDQAFQGQACSLGGYKTQGSDYGVSKTIGESPSRKRKQAPTDSHDQVGHQKGLSCSSETHSDRSCKRTMTSDQIRTQPATPASRVRSDENRMRRSNRKKRKISNYAQLIDVGGPSSGEESG